MSLFGFAQTDWNKKIVHRGKFKRCYFGFFADIVWLFDKIVQVRKYFSRKGCRKTLFKTRYSQDLVLYMMRTL